MLDPVIRDLHRRSGLLTVVSKSVDAAEAGRRHADLELVASIDRKFATMADRAGARLACRPGCDNCCHGLFPITELDRRRLVRGLNKLSRSEPARAEALRERSRIAIDQLTPGFPGDPSTGRLAEDSTSTGAFVERHVDTPCPALDPDSGCCDLYAARPIICRVHGAPLRFGDVTSPPCELCFRGATAAEIEARRFDPDPDDREGALLAELAAAGSERGETLVAWALVPPE